MFSAHCLSRLALAWLVASVCPTGGLAKELTNAPQLRVDPAAHTALIRRLATDSAGRRIITVSDDKTARVWSAADGRLLASFRPPANPGDEGKLNAVAVSPDNGLAAVGGWTGVDWNEPGTIYLFEPTTGRLLRRIEGAGDIILSLAFSPDGSLLAATLGKGGIRVFETRSGRAVGQDKDYDGSSYHAEFSPNGMRLVATGDDGDIRLYGVAGLRITLLVRKRAAGGGTPGAARFAPDGRRIAVGFDDQPAVNVLDSATLSLQYSPDTKGVGKGLGCVAWTHDGGWLYAAGLANKAGRMFVRRWPVSNGKMGAAQDSPVSASIILDLVALPDGRVAFASGEPAWGVMSAGGPVEYVKTSMIADYRDNLSGLAVSDDGTRVAFAYEQGGAHPAAFDLRMRKLLADSPAGLKEPNTAGVGFDRLIRPNTIAPEINAAASHLTQGEVVRSAAILGGAGEARNGFVLGADWSLRAYTREGRERWNCPAHGAVWAVNTTTDGRLIVAAYGDGTIRWHRVSDGAELLAFYPHVDRKRWVLWTPSGYYDASPGAEDFIGWHINRGKDLAADSFAASKFRATFYRPDMVAAALAVQGGEGCMTSAKRGVEQALAAIDLGLPPVVQIISPMDREQANDARLMLRYRVRTPRDAPLTSLIVRADGDLLATSRGFSNDDSVLLQDGEREYSLEMQIPQRDLDLEVVAENRHGFGVSNGVRVLWSGAPRDQVAGRRLSLLAIGVSRYDQANLQLAYASKDAQDVAKALGRKQRMYSEYQELIIPDATRAEFLEGLDWLVRNSGPDDTAVFFFAGHGLKDSHKDLYFLPRDGDPAKLGSTGVPSAEVTRRLGRLRGKVIAFIDACYAARAMERVAAIVDINLLANTFSDARRSVVVFTSSQGAEQSLEDSKWGNGAFTKALVEGLRGQADNDGDHIVTIAELEQWLAKRVKVLTDGRQSPTVTKPGPVKDEPIVDVQ